LCVLVLVLAAAGAWELSGGRLLVMETPSMCPEVCVGSLVADRPLQGPLRVGELITFHPPNDPRETYTHDVFKILPSGTIETKGAANPSPDPWRITRSDIVGRTVFSVWGLGWLLKAIPFLGVGVLLWVAARPRITLAYRRGWDRMWATLLVVVPLWALHPLVKGAVISVASDPAKSHWARALAVDTGLFPVAFTALRGQVASHVAPTTAVHVAGPIARNGYLLLRETVSLYWWGWALVALGVASPVIGYLWHTYRGNESPAPPQGEPLAL
jgi:hypothetical protein